MARPRMALHVASSCARRGRAAFASWPALARALSTTSSSVEHAFKSNPHEDVPLLQRQPEPAASVPAERLFTQNQPGALSAEDLNRFYELDVATLEKHFPEGVNVGVHREFRATNLAALLVRQCTLDACALLESMRDDADALARTAAVVIDGPRGVGKSALLTSLVHACRASGWLVLSIPSAHVYLNSAPTIAQLSGARVEMSSTGRDDLAELCDVTGSTMGVMRGLLAAHDDALLELPAKCAETAAFADESGVRLENLNDLAQLGATDEALAPHALTLALRELREVDARPVAIVLDDANAFEHGVRAACPRDGARRALLTPPARNPATTQPNAPERAPRRRRCLWSRSRCCRSMPRASCCRGCSRRPWRWARSSSAG